jgi:hypothetical protein
MRAQVATFAGCPMPSQFVRRQAPKKLLITLMKHISMYPNNICIKTNYGCKLDTYSDQFALGIHVPKKKKKSY